MPPVRRGKHPRTTPTFKQKKFAKAYIENNGNASLAAKESYDVKSYRDAMDIGHQNLKKPIVQETIKELLDKSGLSMESLNNYSQKAVELSLSRGKPTFASGVSMLQFLYKLHNALPKKESVHFSFSRRESLTVKTFDESKKDLETQTEANQKLLQDLNS